MDNDKNVIIKVADVKALDASESDLRKINKFALSPLKGDDVFVFKAILADNEMDDRNGSPFNTKALKDMEKLYIGKTVLKDHDRKADNQVGRVFDTEISQNTQKLTDIGEYHTELIGKVYMVRTESNADLIKEIEAGIKKEVSTSCMPTKMVCNICGTDNMKDYCMHFPNRTYEVTDEFGKSSKKTCRMLIQGVKETYELSLVAVPSQPRAGTTKNIERRLADEKERYERLNLNAKINDSFLFVNMDEN